MTDPERLVIADSSRLARSLLNAAREDSPDEKLLQHTLLGVGIGAGSGLAAGASGGAGAAAGAKAAGSSLVTLVIKWLGIGMLGGLATAGAAAGVEHAVGNHAQPATLPPVVTAAPERHTSRPPARRATVPPTAPPTAAFAPPEMKRAPAHHAPPEAKLRDPAKDPDVAAAIHAIDAARKALAAGDSGKVLAIVHAYESTPPPHEFEQEALYLEMKALSRSGSPAARSVARQLLTVAPNGPYAAPAQQILGPSR